LGGCFGLVEEPVLWHDQLDPIHAANHVVQLALGVGNVAGAGRQLEVADGAGARRSDRR